MAFELFHSVTWLSPAFSTTPTADYAEQARRLAVVREMSKELSSQVVTLLPFQVALVGAIYATSTKENPSALWLNISVALVAVSFWLAAAALSRVVSRTEWTVASEDQGALQTGQAKALAFKGLAVTLESYCLLFAAVAVAMYAFSATWT